MNVSFSSRAFLKVATSDILNPSNCQLRPIEDKGSILRSLKDIDIGQSKIDNRIVHYCGKPIRFVARAVAIYAISIILAPAGVIYHGIIILRHTVIALTRGEKSGHNWEKVRKYQTAMWTDFKVSVFAAAGTAAFTYSILFGIAGLTPKLAFLIYFKLFTCSARTSVFACSYQSKEIRSPLIKAMMLKNDFGIVGRNNKLLKSNPEEDQERLGLGHFEVLNKLQGLEFLKLIKEIESNEKMKFPHYYPPTADKYIDYYKKSKKLKNNPEWAVRLKTIEDKINKIGDIRSDCFSIEGHLDFSLFPIPEKACRLFMSGIFDEIPEYKPQPTWDDTLDANIKDLTNLEEERTKEYIEYREKLRNRVSAREFLSINEELPLKDALRVALRKARLIVHPDKNPNWQVEANAIFDCVEAAKAILEPKKPHLIHAN